MAQAQPAANAAQRHIAEVQRGRTEKRELLAFVFRLAFVLATIALRLLAAGPAAAARLAVLRDRNRARRLLGVLAFAMAVDYLTDYFEPLELGPLVISLFGIAAPLAFVGLQRLLAFRNDASEGRVPVLRLPRSRNGLRGLRPGSDSPCAHCMSRAA